jgi:hypothetical protein
MKVRCYALIAALLVTSVGTWGDTGSAPAPVAKTEDGYAKVGFEQLASFTFTPPLYDPAAKGKAATGEEQIPAAIKALDGHKVTITGYMVPVKMDKGLVTEFLLMRNTMACCFGGVPNMNEWVVVKMREGVPSLMDVPLLLSGSLKVGAIVENGYLTGIYQVAGEKLVEAK